MMSIFPFCDLFCKRMSLIIIVTTQLFCGFFSTNSPAGAHTISKQKKHDIRYLQQLHQIEGFCEKMFLLFLMQPPKPYLYLKKVKLLRSYELLISLPSDFSAKQNDFSRIKLCVNIPDVCCLNQPCICPPRRRLRVSRSQFPPGKD